MISQPSVTANTADILYSTRALLFVMLLCLGYSLSRPTPVANQESYFLMASTTGSGLLDKKWPDLPAWQKAASRKAIEKYAGSQEKKWRRWNEVMFERSD